MVAVGDARDGICEAVEKLRPRYLVIGSHGYGALKRYDLHSYDSCVILRGQDSVNIGYVVYPFLVVLYLGLSLGASVTTVPIMQSVR